MIQRVYVAILAAACLIGLGVTYTALRNRKMIGADALAATGIAATIWAGGTIGLTLATSPAGELRWLQISYVGMVAAPIAFVTLAARYTGHNEFLPPYAIRGLGGIGLVFLALVWTNPAHQLYWAEIDYTAAVPEGISTTPALGFWAFVVFTYCLLLVGSVFFVRYALTAPNLYRAQTVAILIAVAAPWAANIPHVLQVMTADYTPIALSITGAALWVAMFRYRLTEIGPVALRTVFENISAGVYVLDRENRVIEANTAGAELFDISHDVVGTEFEAIAPNDAFGDILDTAGETREIVTTGGEDSDGTTATQLYYEVTVTPIETGRRRPDSRVVVISDVTETQRQKRELKRQNEHLDQFASVVSHDLRNPLSVADGYLQLAQEECDSPALENIEDAHERMRTLTDDLLQLARAGKTIDETERVWLKAPAVDAWQMVTTDAATIDIDADEYYLDADVDRLRQLFENLFRNSVEHGSTSNRPRADDAVEHGDSTITVRVGVLENDDGFYVADDGAGIPADKREQVFDPGYTTHEDGSGLGLVTVKRIAEAHGWSVQIEESADGGARFEIRTRGE